MVSRLIVCCALAHRPFRLGKLGVWEPRKKRGWKIKVLKKNCSQKEGRWKEKDEEPPRRKDAGSGGSPGHQDT